MKKYLFLLTILLSFQVIFAQNALLKKVINKKIDRVTEKTQNKLDQKIDEKIDRTVDRQLEKLDNNRSTQDAENKASDEVNSKIKHTASGKTSSSKIEPFPTMSMTMVMEFPMKSKNNMSMNYFMRNYDCAFEIHAINQKSEMDRMIMNFKEGKTTLLMTSKDGKKTGMVINLKLADIVADKYIKNEADDFEAKKINIIATNEYKTIEGYKCRKYIYENEDYKNDIWITNDVSLDYVQMNKAIATSFVNSKNNIQNEYMKAGIKGMMIQNHMHPKTKKGDETIMTIKNIKTGNISNEKFSTADYEVMEMPSLSEMFKQSKEK